MTGDIEGESYAGGVMAPMASNSDKWIASVVSFIRTNFENESSVVSVADVARVRKETASRTKPYTFEELTASVPRVVSPGHDWKVTASHTGEVRKGGTNLPTAAFTFEGWTTGVTQKKGMSFQVELPREIDLAEIHFRSPPISRGWREGSPPPIPTYPRSYDVEVSLDGNNWEKVISNGSGNSNYTVIKLPRTTAKYFKIVLTKDEQVVHGERRGLPYDYEVSWTMREMKIYAYPSQ